MSRFDRQGSCIEHKNYACSLCMSRDFADDRKVELARPAADNELRQVLALERIALALEELVKRAAGR